MAATTTTPLTVDQFLELPESEGQRIELIHGEAVTMSTGGYAHEVVKSNLGAIFNVWLSANPIGKLFSETSFRLDDYNSPMPDVSLVLKRRLVPGTQGLLRGAPDVAIEVVSSETAAHLETKISLYLAHGCQCVLVAYPQQRLVRVYDSTGLSRKLDQHQVLEGIGLLPGFSVPVSEIFDGV